MQHPGGEEILVENSGKISSEEFEDVGHSSDAREMMKEYYVGDLHPVSEEVLNGLVNECRTLTSYYRVTTVVSD